MHPTTEQAAAIAAIEAFVLDDDRDAFVLRGSAGTGKSTLVAQLVQRLAAMKVSHALLAPTGRAARVLGDKVRRATGSADEASTIHRAIYRFGSLDVVESAVSASDPGYRLCYPLKESEPTVNLYVIDEASMVGDLETRGDAVRFGTGRLLRDLVTHARLRRPGRTDGGLTKLLFVGDPMQLPPVGERASPALDEAYLSREFGLRVVSFELTQVLRQAAGSAILDRATALRTALQAGAYNRFSLQPDGQAIVDVSRAAAVDRIVADLRSSAPGVAVVHTNARALDYNRCVRQQLWGDADAPLQAGDRLLVNRNAPRHGLNNGDLVEVREARQPLQRVLVPVQGGHRVELQFRAVQVVLRDGERPAVAIELLALENLLQSRERELSALEQRALLVHFRQRHPRLRPRDAEFLAVLRADPYFNALQVKYGYALTCHKAQGGEWPQAIVDFDYRGGHRNAAFFRWAYTAITRASTTLAVVDAPAFSALSAMDWTHASSPVAPPAKAPGATPCSRPADDPQADPDWQRLGFTVQTAPLLEHHRRLRAAWAGQGIAVRALDHLAYCERYTVERDGLQARIQYHYKANLRPGPLTAAPGAAGAAALVADALDAGAALPPTASGGGAASAAGAVCDDSVVAALLAQIDQALAGSSIERTQVTQMPYRLRVALWDGRRSGAVDFVYKRSGQCSQATEVGGPGAAMGLYDELRQRMAQAAGAMPAVGACG